LEILITGKCNTILHLATSINFARCQDLKAQMIKKDPTRFQRARNAHLKEGKMAKFSTIALNVIIIDMYLK
jgi:hypothetical protein